MPATSPQRSTGSDVVVQALGVPMKDLLGPVRLFSEATNVLVPAMEAAGIRRLLAVTGFGTGDSHEAIGLLFIDFETPNRLRVQGRAALVEDVPDGHPGAELLVRIRPTEIFVNCSRYIHRYRKIEESRHTPKADRRQPLAQWKRIDYVVDSLSEADRRRVAEEGTISQEEYKKMVASAKA